MRFRLFLILIGVIVLSLASGLGLRFVMAAWHEPMAAPPGDNVPEPINVGSGVQTKTGSLTIGGIFTVTGAGSGAVVGSPTGGSKGSGSLNAEKLCIQGECLAGWTIADAFVQGGNFFDALAVLGTRDDFGLAFETNNVEKMRIDTAGNVGIGTTNTNYKIMIAGTAPRIYLMPLGGTNSELDFGSPAMDTHWAVYRDTVTDQLRFWRGDNNVIMTSSGDINSRRCFGPIYVGQTAAAYNGARGGYTSANALCAVTISGSHVCTTSEILETIKCNQTLLPTTDQAWISNGPPGYTARANDCAGWTSTSPSGATTVYGAIWAFDASGGVGWVTTCNMSLKFACCK